jgi:hypothetical protein
MNKMRELINPQQMAQIGRALGEQAVQLFRDHINKQQEVQGGSFPNLAPSTVKAKQKNSRGGVQGNATMRMKATNDFVQNAFQYEINSDGITVFISHLPHKQNKTYNARQAYETRAKHGKTNRKEKPSYVNKYGQVVTYEDIAGWQLRGDFDQGQRSSNNPGANFFGFSRNDEYKMTNTFVQLSYPMIKGNIVDAIEDAIK